MKARQTLGTLICELCGNQYGGLAARRRLGQHLRFAHKWAKKADGTWGPKHAKLPRQAKPNGAEAMPELVPLFPEPISAVTPPDGPEAKLEAAIEDLSGQMASLAVEVDRLEKLKAELKRLELQRGILADALAGLRGLPVTLALEAEYSTKNPSKKTIDLPEFSA